MHYLLAAGGIERVKHAINTICEPAPFFILSCAALAVFLIGYRFWTRPAVAALLGLSAVLYYAISGLDENFFSIISKPDNVPISIMMGTVAFCTWLAFRQAAINDARVERGEPLLEAGADDKVLVWPDLVYIEFIALILCTAGLIAWAILLRAPLEQPADPSVAPNPAKAPWYFLGLQELLVYFDPWIAGVLLPGLIILGLIALPYLDKNPRGNGYYTFKERPLVITMYMLGWVVLWVVLIVFGTFLRGPNWIFFGPYEYWDAHKLAALLNIDFRDLFWIKALHQGLPSHWLVREAPGLIFIGFWFTGVPILMAWTCFRKTYRQIGFIRYAVMSQLLMWMFLVPLKMALRWTINLHYFIAIPELPFNV
ncbi:MAG: hypothetical protein IT449_12510 [Phycisphaerales bacterium]|nr:hypothetical protein [Phycisphaerales bacterium]